MRTPENHTLKADRQKMIIVALLLLIAVPVHSATAEETYCKVIRDHEFDINKTGNKSEHKKEGEAALNDIVKSASSVQERACWSLMFFLSRNANKIDDLTQWQKDRIAEFKIDQTPASLWNLCYQSSCKAEKDHSQWYLGKLNEACSSMKGNFCDQVKTELDKANNPLLLPKKLTPAEKVGKGFLIGAVVLGSASMILGAMHMITPVFQEPVSWASCEANGLRLPCVADRFPTGGGLLGGGAALVIGGAVTWGLKF